MPPPTLAWMISTLRRRSGPPPAPVSRDPFHLVLWEQVAYLVPDDQRARAFAALRSQVGLTPRAIREAPARTLEGIARIGGSIAPPPTGRRGWPIRRAG